MELDAIGTGVAQAADASSDAAWARAILDAAVAPAPPDGGMQAVGTTGAHGADAGGAGERLAIARTLVRSGGTATAEDAATVAGHLASTMTLAQLEKTRASGLHITAARGSVTDYLTRLKGVHPRGYPPGISWDTVTGTVDPADRHNVVIATHDGPDGARVLPGAAQSASADVTLHETGHAINRLDGVGHLASDGPEFASAYRADAGHGPLADGYYHQADASAGRDEAYAESHAEYMHDPAGMKAMYPHLFAYWQAYYGDVP